MKRNILSKFVNIQTSSRKWTFSNNFPLSGVSIIPSSVSITQSSVSITPSSASLFTLPPNYKLDILRKEEKTKLCNTWQVVAPVQQQRLVSDGFVRKVKRTLGLLDYSKTLLKIKGVKLYEQIIDEVNVEDFFRICKMEDTFQSWFLVTQLHIWMVMARVMDGDKEGRFLRNHLISLLWEDVKVRAQKVGESPASTRRKQVNELKEQFNSALLSFDEGIMSNDQVLAAALWRHLFALKCDDPEVLELCLCYVRQHMFYLDNLSFDDILLRPKLLQFTPLSKMDIIRLA